ncbi:type II secretion system F family protein [uncultured Eubacterium sp.]|uniref:type II secretion system F family protein n=1 Tax=Eubacterium pyruvativorans TaxID=155865 RepID=UPI002594D316|nr:type II secretion system F family protein [uncultured Eubacterium sp.]
MRMAIDYRTYRLNRKECVRLAVVLTAGLLALGLLFYESPLPGAVVFLLWKPARKFRENQLRRKRRQQLRLQFRDFLNTISSAFAAGRHFQEALEGAGREMGTIYGEDALIAREIQIMLERMDVSGESELTVLEDFARRTGVEEVSDFAQIFRACRESGGNLAQAVEKSARMLSEKITIEDGIRSMVSQKRFEGEIITLMPVLIVLSLRFLSPGYLDVMYGTAAGRIMMTGCLGLVAAAYYSIERITDIAV